MHLGPRVRTVGASLLGVLATAALASGLVVGSKAGGPVETNEVETVRILAGMQPLAVASVERLRTLSPRRRAAWIDRLPRERVERRGAATVRLRTSRAALWRAFRRALRSGGTVSLPERAVAANVSLPAVKQALRNNCETAALSMLLRARAVKVGQLLLQRQLRRSGPPDPQVEASGTTTWGDPDLGFVGRADGGGTSGGYGVYEAPIAALARRYGVKLRRLSGKPASSIYRTLLAGRPVLAWVGLSDGPFKSWRTPQGRRVTGNFGEHTIVLRGLRGGGLVVNDPLVGRTTTWTRPQFELMWRRLGRRALSL